MSAEVLREAAALMRERAEAATPGPWVTTTVDGLPIVFDTCDLPEPVAYDQEMRAPNADYIAGMNPAVALAVADWLENAAEDIEMQAPDGDLRKQWDMRVHINGDKALAVARAYLGRDS